MSRLFMFLLGKNKDKLEAMLAKVEKKLESDPDNKKLLEERFHIRAELEKCEE